LPCTVLLVVTAVLGVVVVVVGVGVVLGVGLPAVPRRCSGAS